ncbi:hypothetical protein U91I_00805 [alpha proteobacterium U9-1i]|nr:hypothetical protein U91I_00805 [alpha proteobacterium U9-1i]
MDKTLRNALDLGAEGVELYCWRCVRVRRFSAAQALASWPPQFDFAQIAAKSRHRRCGQRASEAKPIWPRRSRGGSEPLPIVPKAWGRR